MPRSWSIQENGGDVIIYRITYYDQEIILNLDVPIIILK